MEIIISTTCKNVRSELIHMTRAWDKEKIRVPDRNLPKYYPILNLGEQILYDECIVGHPRYLEPSLTAPSSLLPLAIVQELPPDEKSRET